MAKMKQVSAFFCSNCGFESSKWMGQCPGCREWNTMTEEVMRTGKATGDKASGRSLTVKPQTLSAISMQEEDKFYTHIAELDRVLGGGIVPGQLVLVGGDPGIGKSTLLLQVCRRKKGFVYLRGGIPQTDQIACTETGRVFGCTVPAL